MWVKRKRPAILELKLKCSHEIKVQRKAKIFSNKSTNVDECPFAPALRSAGTVCWCNEHNRHEDTACLTGGEGPWSTICCGNSNVGPAVGRQASFHIAWKWRVTLAPGISQKTLGGEASVTYIGTGYCSTCRQLLSCYLTETAICYIETMWDKWHEHNQHMAGTATGKNDALSKNVSIRALDRTITHHSTSPSGPVTPISCPWFLSNQACFSHTKLLLNHWQKTHTRDETNGIGEVGY